MKALSNNRRTLPGSQAFSGNEFWGVILAWIVGVQLVVAGPTDITDMDNISVFPQEMELNRPLDVARFLVSAQYSDGAEKDISSEAHYVSQDTDVVLIKGEVAYPVGDGKTAIIVSVAGQQWVIPVKVSGVSQPLPASFANEVVPVLTKAGCNQGACHGSQHGKGGFKLSLFGGEPDEDYESIVKEAEGRRIVRSNPQDSLLLLKPTLSIYHGGSRRFSRDSHDYEVILSWLEHGAPAANEIDSSPVRVSVYPQERVLRPNAQQQLVVFAHYEDGTVRDVTQTAQYDSLNEGIAEVGRDGLVEMSGRGASAVMIRYLGKATVSTLTVPYGKIGTKLSFPSNNFVDQKVVERWEELGLVPSELADDATFLRRVFLDTIGTLPEPEVIRDFLASKIPHKRELMIDRLLGLNQTDAWKYQNEWVAFWSVKWGDLLRNSSRKVGEQGMWALHNWIRESLRNNKPVSEMTYELLTATGSTYSNGPANYYRVARSPEDLAETTAQLFLGVRLQCARCHHHPFEKYSQTDYYGMAAFFARVRTKGNQEFGLFGGGQDVYVSNGGEVRHPKKGQVVPPVPLDSDPLETSFDRRRALASWMVGKENVLFARNFVNRFWGYFMGRGLVDPIDDMRDTNPPTNPELLQALAEDFTENGFDLKHLMQTILRSRVYQLSSSPNNSNGGDDRFFSHYLVKRLSAEQLLDALNSATGAVEKFAKLPIEDFDRAIELPDPSVNSYFLQVFGRPPRETTCECERVAVPNISQALHLANSEYVNKKVTDEKGRVAQLISNEKLTDKQRVEELYLVTLSRLPSSDEHQLAHQLINESPSSREGFQDLLWALCNTKEFMLNH